MGDFCNSGYLFFLFYGYQLQQLFTVHNLITFQTSLHDYTANNYFLVLFLYTFVYFIFVALSIPIATSMSILAGAMFDIYTAVIVSMVSIVCGSMVVFFYARTLARKRIELKYPKLSIKVNRALKNHRWSYLLFLRLFPLFPFFIVNLVLSITRINIIVFTITNFLGMLPIIFLYVQFGSVLNTIDFDTPIVSSRAYIFLILMACLVILPVIFSKLLKNK